MGAVQLSSAVELIIGSGFLPRCHRVQHGALGTQELSVPLPVREQQVFSVINNAAISPKLNPFRRRCRWRIMHLTGRAVG